jgi:hypothetical protein
VWTTGDLVGAVEADPGAAAAALDALPWPATARLDAHALRAAAEAVGRDPAELWVEQLRSRGLLDAFARALQAHGVALGTEPAVPDAPWSDHVDAEQAARFLLRAETIRCRIRVNGSYRGTGCLVGPGLVLTAWHVIAVAAPGEPQVPVPEVVVELSDGSHHRAVVPPRFASPCSPVEYRRHAPSGDDEVASAHDVALLALSSPAARHLGFARLPRTAPRTPTHSTVFLAHFPRGEDPGLGVGRTSRIRHVSARWRHDVRTDPGSSGGACFDNATELIGVHQGVWDRRGLMVPLERFLDDVAPIVDRDVAPRHVWRLDEAGERLVVGRDLFADAVGAAGAEASRVRGVWVKRRNLAASGVGLGYTFDVLHELLLRRGPEHVLVRLPDVALVPDVLVAVRTWAQQAGLPVPEPVGPPGPGPTTAEDGARDRARPLAEALDRTAAELGRTVWFFVDNPAENRLLDPARLALEAFVAAVLEQPRLRVVVAGMETVPLAGLQFPTPEAAAGDGAPGLVVEHIGTFLRRDVADLLHQASRELTGEADPAVVEIATDVCVAPVRGRDVNGSWPLAALAPVAARVREFLDVFRLHGGAGATSAAPPAPESLLAEVATARRFAALSGPFDPVAALRAAGGTEAPDADRTTVVSAALAQECDRLPGEPGRWLLRGTERHRELRLFAGDEGPSLADAIAWRTALGTDQATADLADALLGRGAYGPEGLAALLAEGDDLDALERAAEALDRAGEAAPGRAWLPGVRAALTRAGMPTAAEPTGRRAEEVATVQAWAAQVPAGRLRALYVHGLPGVGKSTLLEDAAATLLAGETPWVAVRLDFARPGLDLQDVPGLTLELVRQVAAQLGDGAEALLAARQAAAGTPTYDVSLKGAARQFVPPELGRVLADAVVREERRLLVLVDSLEVLRDRGETQSARLFAWLDQLVAFGPFPVAVVAAGREGALDTAPGRADRSIRLERPAGDAPPPDDGARGRGPAGVPDLRPLLDRGDWVEAGHAYDRLGQPAVDPVSEDGDTVRTLLWRTGRWSAARRLLRERDRREPGDADLATLARRSPQDAACRLEMRAELALADEVALLRAGADRAALASALVGPGLQASLGAGALRLALLAAGVVHRPAAGEPDPVAAAVGWWGRGGGPAGESGASSVGPDVEESAGWHRVASRVGPGSPVPAGLAGRVRAVTALSPYAELLATMTAGGSRAGLPDLGDSAYGRLDALGLLAPRDEGPWHDVGTAATGGVHALADVGLLAEAVGVAAWLLRDGDLGLVARSAERWRRALAGSWAYPGPTDARPAGWTRTVDLSVADRVAALRAADEPAASAARELDAWCDPDLGLGRVLDLLRERAPATVRRAAAAADTDEAARVLLARQVPSALVPGVVVLLEHSRAPSGRGNHTRGRDRG